MRIYYVLPSIHIHHIVNPEPTSTGFHSHGVKWALSLILSGSYDEDLYEGSSKVRTVRRRFLNFIRRATFHRITAVQGEVWTIFIVGPSVGRTNYIPPEGPKPKKYCQAEAILRHHYPHLLPPQS